MCAVLRFLGELADKFLTPRVLALWLVISCLMAVTGPLGTYDQFGLVARLGYWTGAVGLGLLAGLASSSLVARCCEDRPGWMRQVVLAFVFALILLPVQRLLTHLFHGRPIGALQAFSVIAMVPVTVALLRHFWLGGGGEAHPGARPPASLPAPEGSPPPPPPRLLNRLPPELRGEILHLSVRDHYVEVLTDRGTYSLLMRFSDAMAEAEGVAGLQVHRSHWVAEAAITGGARRAGKAHLTLTDGREVPVSRGFLPQVQAKGYL